MNATLTLVIATLALVVGPLLERVGRRLPALASWIDGATVGGIVVFTFVHLLPEAGEHLGVWAAAWFLAGLVLPTLGERLLHLQAQSWRFSLGALVVVLLVVHEVIESAALASRATSYDANITIATLLVIVGHRLPLGLFIWGHTRARFGLFWSVAALGFLAAASLAGPLLVPERFRQHGEFSAVLSALLAGGLLHLVLQHRPHFALHGAEPRRANAAAALGAVMAAAFFVPYLAGVELDHGHGHVHGASQFPARLWELVQETSLPLLFGVLGAALIEAFLPGSVVGWLARGSRLRQAAAGVVVGAPLPVCSCGVLPIYRSLVRRGVSPTAALAFLIAAPEIGVDSILLSLPMLGTGTTLARLACALLLALLVGLAVGRLAEAAPLRAAHAHDDEHAPPPRGPAALRRALLETWGHLAPWILFGLLVTALVEPWIDGSWSAALPTWLQVVVLALAGMPTYICATAATPFAALLLAKGFSAGAVIAFLLVGPATNVTTFGALAHLHSRRVAAAFAATALGATLLLGWGVDVAAARGWFEAGAAARAGEGEHAHGAVQTYASAFLGLLTLWVLVREGPRGFLAQLWPEGSAGRIGAHDHAHGGAEHGRA